MEIKRMSLDKPTGDYQHLLFHGSNIKIEKPEIRRTRYTKDFSWGFYCTKLESQAVRWVMRKFKCGYINTYCYYPKSNLRVKTFEDTSEEWLDFIVHCRSGGTHDYDVVEGPMADDVIATAIQDYLDGTMNREVLLVALKFSAPTHQISLHTSQALECLSFRGAKYV